MASNGIRKRQIFHLIWIVIKKKSLMEWAQEQCVEHNLVKHMNPIPLSENAFQLVYYSVVPL